MLGTINSIIRRELLIAFRRQADIFNPLWFFIIVITFFIMSKGRLLGGLISTTIYTM